EQDQEMPAGAHLARAVGAEQEAQRVRPVREGNDLVVDPGTANVLLDQPCVPFVVFDHYDRNWSCVVVHLCTPIALVRSRGTRTLKVVPRPSSDCKLMSPPRLRMSARTCASPIPSPFWSCAPARRNSSKTRSRSSVAIPRPLSSISTTTRCKGGAFSRM